MIYIEIFKKYLHKTPKWYLIGETVRGASHVHTGLVNQDAIKWAPQFGGDCYAIMAVSDGHGSARHFRSDRGANIAVEVAISLLGEFREIHKKKDRGNILTVKDIAEEWLPKRLHRNWVEKVMADLASNPVDDSEQERLKAKTPALVNDYELNPLSVYGATLLALLVTPTYVLFMRLGDGDILAVDEKGKVQEILPEDPDMVGDAAYSFSMQNALQYFQVAFQPLHNNSPVMYLLSTDGYSKSFTYEEGFLQVGPDYLERLKKMGREKVQNNLKSWLEKTSEDGSGDDITLGIVYQAQKSKGK